MPASAIRNDSQYGQSQIDGEHHHQVRRDHREFALREIHHVGGAEDQHETERDQRIDRADADSGEQQL